MESKQSIVVLTIEGLGSHIGGLGTYIREIRNHLKELSDVAVHFHEIPYDARYVLAPDYDRKLSDLLATASLVHANDYFTAYATLLRRQRAKLITTVHMLHQRFSYEGQIHDFGLTHSEAAYMENVALSNSDLLVAVSHFIKEEIASLGISLPPVSVVHNGASSNFFDYARENSTTDKIRLGICGRLIYQKGTDLLPDLLSRLKRFSRPWTLEVVGNGPHKDLVERSIVALGLSDRCSIRGWVPNYELPSLYARWDATISLSRYEPFGIAPLESLASGTPILGNVVGGMREFCLEGVNAMIPAKADTDSIIARLRSYFTGSPRLDPSTVRKSVLKFSWDSSVAKLKEAYDSLL